MPQFEISKEFGFDYGHRVHNQKLNTEFSLDDACVCRHLHGHRAKVHVYLSGKELNQQGMVTDFKHLNWLKKFFDDNLDHKFIIDRNDPLYIQMLGQIQLMDVFVPGTTCLAGRVPNLDKIKKGSPEYEYFEGFFVVDFVPTSENLSRWTYTVTQNKMAQIGIYVSKIDWWETPKSCSTYVHYDGARFA